MAYLKGEDVNLGVARETTRGTPETPTQWIPGRTPTGVRMLVETAPIRETRGTGIGSQGSVVVQKRTEGDLEFNVRNNSIGMLFLSLLGTVNTSAAGTGAYSHVFTVLTGNPQFPVLTLGLSQLGQQDYEYSRCLVTALEIRTPVNDLVNATVSFVGAAENTHADYTPSFATDDHYFRHYDITLKIASNVAGISGASALKVKEFSLSIVNNGRVNQNVSELVPGDVLAILHEITGSLRIDYQDETFHDLYAAGTYRALQIEMKRTDIDIDTGGGTQNPTVSILLPKVSFTAREQDRPIDDIVSETLDFTAHYDEAETKAIQVTVVNTTANYN